MRSLGARLIGAAIRLLTYPRRKKCGSLSESVKQRRRPYEPPDGMTLSTIEAGAVKVEILTPEKFSVRLIHFHGGGRTQPLEGFYRSVAELYADRLCAEVWSIDCRTGGDLVHPALLDDCLAALDAIAEVKPLGCFAAIGDSLGAALMFASCMKLRDAGRAAPFALIAFSPFCDLSASGESYLRNAHKDPIYGLPYHMSASVHGARLRRVPAYCGGTPPTDPYLSPVFGDLKGLPPIAVYVGGYETSESDAEMIAAAAERGKVPVRLTVADGLFHDFMLFAPFLKESKRVFADVAAFLRSTGAL